MEMLNNKRIREPKEQTLEYYKIKNDRESENYVCWGKKFQNIFYKYILKYFSLDIMKRGTFAGSFFGIFLMIFG